MEERSFPVKTIARRPRYLGPLVGALMSIVVAFWAQSLAERPDLTDALILFTVAAALLAMAGRDVLRPAPADVPDASDGETEVRLPAPSRDSLPAGERMPEKARFLPDSLVSLGRERGRRIGIALAVAGVALNLITLPLFGQRPVTGLPWLIYLASLVFAFCGTWLIARRPSTGPLTAGAVSSSLPRRRELLLLALVILAGAALRFYRLDDVPAGFWYDEAKFGLEAMGVLQGTAFPIYFESNTCCGMAYIYFLAPGLKLFGSSVFAARFATVVLGILTIPAFYALAKLLFGPHTALVAALLLATSRWHITFSRWVHDGIAVPLLSVACFYFLVKAFRRRRVMDFVAAGIAMGLGLQTYAAFRLVPLIALGYVAFQVIQTRRIERATLKGLVVLSVATVMVASPLLLFAVQRPEVFNQRTGQMSVFAGKDPGAGVQALAENARKHLLMFNAVGDNNGRHNIPNEPMFDPVTGAVFVLGLGYALYRLRRPAYAFLIVWFLVALGGGIFSVEFEAPQALRSFGALPAGIMLAAVVFDRVLRLREGHGRVVSGAASAVVIALLAFIAYLNASNYFDRQANNTASWTAGATAQTITAKEMNELGSGWTFFVSSTFYNYPTIRYLAPQVTNYRPLEANDHLPFRDRSIEKAALFASPAQKSLYEQARRLYPKATFIEHLPPAGSPPALYEARVLEDDLRATWGLDGRYFKGTQGTGAPALERRDSVLSFDWSEAAPIPPPFTVEWTGQLYADRYGSYVLGVRSPGGVEVWVDEKLHLSESGEQTARLAKGDHALRVRAEVAEVTGRTELYWKPPDGTQGTVPASAFFAPPVSNNGLLGSYYANANWAGEPALQQIDPGIALNFHNTVLPRPYSVEWSGKVAAPVAGEYAFGLESVDASSLEIDGNMVVEARDPNRYQEGRVRLTEGWHELRLRYLDASRASHVNLYWTPPGRTREIVPTQYLLPPQGRDPSTTPALPPAAQAPAAPQATAPGPAKPATVVPAKPAPAAPSAGPPPITPSVLMSIGRQGDGAGELNAPRDIAVGLDGTIYVADTGNARIAVFDAVGQYRAQIGSRGAEPGQLMAPIALSIAPGGDLLVIDDGNSFISRFAPDGTFRGRFAGEKAGFYHARGLAVAPDGTVYVANTGLARIVVFDSQGQKSGEIGSKGSDAGQLLGPVGIAVDTQGTVWVADVENNRVQRLSPEGSYVGGFAVKLGESVDGAHLTPGPAGIYLTDPVENRVLYYGWDGTPLAQWGQRGEAEGEFRRPVGIAVDAAGNIYVVERDNHRVQKFPPAR